MVYCGGASDVKDHCYLVYCYDPSQDKWTTLPPLPIKMFGLGQVNGELVAVGGVKREIQVTDNIYTYDKRSEEWKQTIPPMPTARRSPGVLSLQSALLVAGGSEVGTGLGSIAKVIILDKADCVRSVEVFRPDASQWYRTDPLPTPCRDISLVAIGNTCYAIGGYRSSTSVQMKCNGAFCASVDNLLGNAVPATHSGSSDAHHQRAWKIIKPCTPTYGPVAAVLAGNLLAIGGSNEPKDSYTNRRMIYMYIMHTHSWVYIGSIPPQDQQVDSIAVELSSVEILIIAGSSVHKGTPMVFK